MNEPKLRFPGFTEPWEQRKLGELCQIATGKLDANAMVEDGKYDFYTSGIQKFKIDKFAFEGPAITIAGNGATVGYMHLADDKFNAYQRTYVLCGFIADRYFLYPEIGKMLPKKIANEVRAGSIPYIVMDMLTELEVLLPSNEEQIKIGIFFKNLDDLITLHQRKLDDTKLLKQSMLQKMFPKNGKDKPEIRFPGFTDAWEQRKLGELLEFSNGFNGRKELYGHGIPCISVMDILNNNFITCDVIRGKVDIDPVSEEHFKVKFGDVLFQRSSENVEDAGSANVFVDQKRTAVFGGFTIRGAKVGKYDPYFMRYMLATSAIRKQIVKKAQGAQHINVGQETLESITIKLPSMEEQSKISTFLYRLEDLIACHQHELDSLKQLKQSLLQQMFI